MIALAADIFEDRHLASIAASTQEESPGKVACDLAPNQQDIAPGRRVVVTECNEAVVDGTRLELVTSALRTLRSPN
jgi:hypothetical protein